MYFQNNCNIKNETNKKKANKTLILLTEKYTFMSKICQIISILPQWEKGISRQQAKCMPGISAGNKEVPTVSRAAITEAQPSRDITFLISRISHPVFGPQHIKSTNKLKRGFLKWSTLKLYWLGAEAPVPWREPGGWKERTAAPHQMPLGRWARRWSQPLPRKWMTGWQENLYQLKSSLENKSSYTLFSTSWASSSIRLTFLLKKKRKIACKLLWFWLPGKLTFLTVEQD